MANTNEPRVNLFNPQGDVVSIPQSQSDQAIQYGGFSQGSPEDIQDAIHQQKYGSTGQQALTALEGAGEAATFGLSTAAEAAAGVKGEDITGRREANPYSHMAGQAAGLVGSTLIPGVGAASVLERAGAGAAEAVGLGAGETVLSKIGSAGVKGAVENAMVQSGDEVSKMFASDPNQSVQTALTDVGLASLLGGTISGGIGAVHPLWHETTGGKLGGWLEAIQRKVNGESVKLPENIQSALNDTAIGGEQLPLPPELRSGMSEVPDLQKQFNILQESKTMPGQKLQDTVQKFEESAGQHIVKSLGGDADKIKDSGEISNFDAGTSIKDELADQVKKRFEPLNEAYERITDKFGKVELKGEQNTAADRLAELSNTERWDQSPSSPAYKLLNETLAELPNIKDLEGLRRYQSSIRQKVSSDPGALSFAGRKINGVLNDVLEESYQNYAGQKGDKVLLDFVSTQEKYRLEKQVLSELDDRLHLGGGGEKMTLHNLREMAPEQVLSRLSKANDAGLLELLQKEFPSVAQLVKDHQLSKLLGNAASKAHGENPINMKTFFNAYDKMTPEMRKFVVGGAGKQIDAVRTLMDRVPTYKSSGTAGNLDSLWSKVPGGAMAMMAMLTGHNPALGFMIGQTGKWLSRDAPDAIRLGFLKFLGHDGAAEPQAFKSMVDFIQATIKGQNNIKKGTEAVFKAGRQVLSESQMPSDKDREKLDKRLLALHKDPTPLLDTGGKTSYYLPDHGASIGQTASNAVNYLNGLRPVEDPKAPLDSKDIANPVQKAQFNRALEIAEQPLAILQSIKEGTLTPGDVIHLKNLYPDLYAKFQNQLMEQVINRKTDDEPIPYKTRLSLSLFMAQPLDSTMTPMALNSTQLVPTNQPQPPPQRPKHSMTALNKMSQGVATPGQSRELEKTQA